MPVSAKQTQPSPKMKTSDVTVFYGPKQAIKDVTIDIVDLACLRFLLELYSSTRITMKPRRAKRHAFSHADAGVLLPLTLNDLANS